MLFGCVRLGHFLLKVFEHLLNHLGSFDAGNDFNLAAAVFADLDVDIKDTLETLYPSHGTMALCGAHTRRYRDLPACRASYPAWQASLAGY